MLTQCKRYGRIFDMSKLPADQLALFQRAAAGGAEIDGTTYLKVDDFSERDLAKLVKALRARGVLNKGEPFK